MMLRDQVLQVVLDMLREVNINRSPEAEIIGTAETRLLGSHSGLDSIELVRLLLDVEDRISTELNTPIALMDERAMSQEHSPFKSVNTLTDYIVTIIEEEHA